LCSLAGSSVPVPVPVPVPAGAKVVGESRRTPPAAIASRSAALNTPGTPVAGAHQPGQLLRSVVPCSSKARRMAWISLSRVRSTMT
jgi:hypothetical protein